MIKTSTWMALLTAAGIALGAPAQAADTLIGPHKLVCKDVMKQSAADAGLAVMWVAGFASAVNRNSKVDLLEGYDISTITRMFTTFCDEKPQATVEEAAITIVGRLRAIMVMKLEAAKRTK